MVKKAEPIKLVEPTPDIPNLFDFDSLSSEAAPESSGPEEVISAFTEQLAREELLQEAATGEPAGRLDEPAPSSDTSNSSPDDWMKFSNPMPNRILNDYPFTGAPVWLTPDGSTAVEAVWRATRSMDSRLGRWGSIGFWAARNAGGRQIDFVPLGWKRHVE